MAETTGTCGIVMPISMTDECDPQHWNEVRAILSDSISEAGFEPKLVSSADESGVIHKRIIQNLYENEIVVCDVSGKNPNVMFELGLRLAFDKPTIIVKDDKTGYSFDTGSIEHLKYPRDLRFQRIADFQDQLTEKVARIFERSKSEERGFGPKVHYRRTEAIARDHSKARVTCTNSACNLRCGA